jgi:hypothetical protein
MPNPHFDPAGREIDALLRAMSPDEEYLRRLAMQEIYPRCRSTVWQRRLDELARELVRTVADARRYSRLANQAAKLIRAAN